jgi:hypothetical protein
VGEYTGLLYVLEIFFFNLFIFDCSLAAEKREYPATIPDKTDV